MKKSKIIKGTAAALTAVMMSGCLSTELKGDYKTGNLHIVSTPKTDQSSDPEPGSEPTSSSASVVSVPGASVPAVSAPNVSEPEPAASVTSQPQSSASSKPASSSVKPASSASANNGPGIPSGPVIPVSSTTGAISILGANMVYVGETFSYSFVVNRELEYSPDIQWQCIGDCGEIDQNGQFRALKKGSVKLVVWDAENGISTQLEVFTLDDASDMTTVPMVNGIIVVNKTYPLPASYDPGGLTAETSAAFKKLVAGAADDGLSIRQISGYRSYEKQKNTYAGWCNKYGKEYADTISARPGFSEHQLGMALDVNSLEFEFENTAEGQWLKKHCAEYGFIIRYPKGKESITGYAYEPWHIRYVGKELAAQVMASGLCLEEFLDIDSRYR